MRATTGIPGSETCGCRRHEGRRDRQGPVNVDSVRSHEGRGAGKTDPLGGRILVSKKK